MTGPKYRVKGSAGSRYVVGADAIAAFCLHQTGGGYTAEQTAKAMELQRKAIETGQLSRNITIEQVYQCEGCGKHFTQLTDNRCEGCDHE